MTLHDRCLPIELLLMDVDGVLTDGSIVYGDNGCEWKTFFVRDGSGLKFWRQAGKRAGIITGRRSPVVARRAAELDLTVVVEGADDKLAAWNRILTEQGLTPRQVCYLGDDAMPPKIELSDEGFAKRKRRSIHQNDTITVAYP